MCFRSMMAGGGGGRGRTEITAVMVVWRVHSIRSMSSIVEVPGSPASAQMCFRRTQGPRGGIRQSETLSLHLHPQLPPTDSPPLPPPPPPFTLSLWEAN